MYHNHYAAEMEMRTRRADADRAAQQKQLVAEARAQHPSRQGVQNRLRALMAQARSARVLRLLGLRPA